MTFGDAQSIQRLLRAAHEARELLRDVLAETGVDLDRLPFPPKPVFCNGRPAGYEIELLKPFKGLSSQIKFTL